MAAARPIVNLGGAAVIISRTPFRISFFGGGTDYPAWYRRYGGRVLATAIDKYCYITCRYLPPFFEHRIRVVYAKTENCQTVGEIAHPVVREVLRYLQVDRGVEIHHDGDLPARSGMGTSSAFTVGLLHALHALKGAMLSKKQLARESIYIEQEVLKETVGAQDQVLSAYGGFNRIAFHPDGEITVEPVTLAPDRLQELAGHLMLFFTGLTRTASEIAEGYVRDVERAAARLRALGDMVDEGLSILNRSDDIALFGKLLHEAWQAKRGLSPDVSNGDVEAIYQAARSAGAIGGKLVGAGGGGFMLLFVPPARRQKVREALHRLLHVPFKFASAGSQIIFFDVEEDYADEDRIRSAQELAAFRELTSRS
jgi:D-glycero-alpha-D-manno-heptose-7-phosphate kinase